ncbi:MAG TPA: PorP/SprF family type IX secretion system membrane protein [Saprospiraceae bacterium]|nr:PorP/SprF family type IX secretion system membrane protein [Saprospiraceae bacterium]
MTVSLVVLSVFALNAQDIHFSQFYLSPLNLNPAMTGVMNCNVRLSGNYRQQWSSVLKSYAFKTYSASYDQRIPVGRYDYFGVGGTFWGDKAGRSDFAQLQAKLSVSYSKRMGGYRKKAHYMVVGLDGGILQRSIDFLNLQWGSQHNGEGGYDPTKPTFENFNRDNVLVPDLSAGLLWFSVFDQNNNFYLGAAYHHLNRADISFDDQNPDLLYSRFTIHAGGEFALTDRLGLVPGFITMIQGKSMEINTGTSFRFLLNKTRYEYQALQFGIWARIANKLESGVHTDAAILSTRFDYNDFSLGFSYDINVSDLNPASNSNGAFEFALIYKICGPEKRNVYCPNF